MVLTAYSLACYTEGNERWGNGLSILMGKLPKSGRGVTLRAPVTR
jgi:hypothetical protein